MVKNNNNNNNNGKQIYIEKLLLPCQFCTFISKPAQPINL